MTSRHSGWQQRRRFFLARVAALLVVVLVTAAAGLSQLIATATRQAGVEISPPLIAIALMVTVFGVLFLFVSGMRGVGTPLGDIVTAAERVGSGDYSGRLIERGPPFLRTVARAFNAMTSSLETQQRQRRDLMADVAHELRTPLAVMRGRLEGIVDGVYARDDTTLATLLDETRLLERLVDDLRTMAHAEGGTLTLQKEPTDIGVLLGDVVRMFAGRAQTEGVALRADVPATLPLTDVDALRLREVVANLVANALRYTPRGGRIEIAASSSSEAITIDVSDTGAGIPAEELPRIFDRFAKGDDSRGSGLGLAIARRLTEAHGGTISAASTPGAGTAITIRLPREDRIPSTPDRTVRSPR